MNSPMILKAETDGRQRPIHPRKLRVAVQRVPAGLRLPAKSGSLQKGALLVMLLRCNFIGLNYSLISGRGMSNAAGLWAAAPASYNSQETRDSQPA